jgi:hypothetical protein
MDLDAPVVSPTKQPLEVMQPAKGALDKHAGSLRSEPCSVWRRAISGAVSDQASTSRTRNRRHRAFRHARRASDCDRLRSSTSSVSQADR